MLYAVILVGNLVFYKEAVKPQTERDCSVTRHRDKNMLLTDTVREILHTKKRFLSLFVMSLLAVGFLAGLRMTAPDMHNTVDHYYDRQNFMDIRLISMLGLTQDDLEAVSQVPGVKAAEGSRTFDALAGEDCVNVLELPREINLLDLTEGRLPKSSDECVTEVKILEALHKEIGDTITIDTKESFDAVLGEDPLAQQAGSSGEGSSGAGVPHSTKHTYKIVGIARSPLYISRTRSGSSVGTGSVTGFVVLPSECFTQDVYSTIYLELEGLDSYNCYTDDAYKEQVDDFIESIKPLAKERARIREKQVTEEVTFADMAAALIAGIAQSGSSGSGSALSGLDTSSGEWYILDRETIRSYVEFSSDSERMGNLADVFPLIFFLVAALSSLTSMTRMVEDHRAEIGTMKALGFSTASISIKYIGYALAASLIGGGAGLAIGCTALPSLIYYEWGILYLLPKLEMSISPVVVLYSLGAAVLATAGAAFAACYATLLARPAELLRPRAPKPGKRIFLEYIGPVWKRLSFIQKVSARNLFRYKKRFWMTIIGIAGCTALLATGFGLRDSIFDVLTWQFDDLMPYNATISVDAGLNPSDRAEMMEALEADPGIASFLGCYDRGVSVRTDEGTIDGVALRSSSGWTTYTDGNDSHPAAEDEKEYPVTVGGICENYVGHYVHMTASCYKKVFGERPRDNVLLVKATENSADRVMKIKGVITYNSIDETRDHFHESMKSLDVVVWIIIGAAAALAFLVLFNLTNINVTERVRELATLKVLGFYDGETASYVYRENIILTMMGAALGLLGGKWLHRWLIGTIEMEYMIFGHGLHGRSYLYAVILTVIFSLSVNFFSYFYIRRIDMVESLKSVE